LEPMVATEEAAEFQAAEPLTSCVDPSLNVAVAVNCCWVPFASVAIAGVTAIKTNAAPVTFRVMAGDIIPPSDAVTRVLPTPEPAACPELLTVATVGVADFHDTVSVTS
jgi:hypothetical protein